MTSQTSPPPTYAYVTVLSTDSYLDGVIALQESMRAVGTRFPLWVLVGKLVSPVAREVLRRLGLPTLDVEQTIRLPENLAAANAASDFPHWTFTMEKLCAFSLQRFSKLVLIDSDMIVLANLDDLFARPHLSAVAAGCSFPGNEHWAGGLNSGLMVIEPRADAVERLLALVPADGTAGIEALSDQDIIKRAHPEWAGRRDLHLDEGDNVFAAHLDHYVRRLGRRPGRAGGVRIVHFVGAGKPWMMSPLERVRRCLRLARQGHLHECRATLTHAVLLARGRRRARRGATLAGRREALSLRHAKV